MSKNKRIKLVFDMDSDTKIPKVKQNPESYFDATPAWCFSKSDNYEKWSILQADFFSAILPKLISFEQRTWSDIISDKKHNHWIRCEDFSKEAQERLNAIPQSTDSLFSLRLSGMLRLFGFIEDGVYYIIWVDRKHEVCPSKKKHT